MPYVVPIKFPFAKHLLWFSPEALDESERALTPATEVVCATARGEEYGQVEEAPFEVDEAKLKETIGDAKLSDLLRIATEQDIQTHEELVQRAFKALPKFREFAKTEKLPIKPVGIEFTLDGKTAICYFAAEERVDFRQLVRNLARELSAKIDMRQIGVREEAGVMGGFAQCGQELCCARWETEFAPISIRMAKDQDLPLNSPKISGVCGRLMCCLRYEVDAYKDFKKRAPRLGSAIATPLGEAKVSALSAPTEQITLKFEDDTTLRVPLSALTCLTNEGQPAAARPNTLTQEALDDLQSKEEVQTFAFAASGSAATSAFVGVSKVSEGLAEEDRIEIAEATDAHTSSREKKHRKKGKEKRGRRDNKKAHNTLDNLRRRHVSGEEASKKRTRRIGQGVQKHQREQERARSQEKTHEQVPAQNRSESRKRRRHHVSS